MKVSTRGVHERPFTLSLLTLSLEKEISRALSTNL